MAGKCTICGETDPLPASLCLAKLTGDARSGEPCQYSAEGCERTRIAMEEQSRRIWPSIKEAKAHGARIREEQETRHGNP